MSIYDRKYGGNSRNLWRKVYGYQNNRPQAAEVVNLDSSTTSSLDLNKMLRHRDFFIIKGIIGSNIDNSIAPIPPPTGSGDWEYYEDLIFLNGGTDDSVSFPFAFSGVPTVTITPESASLWGNNVQIIGLVKDPFGFEFTISSGYSGSLRYRALYVPTSDFAIVTSSYTASITASRGSTNIQNLSAYTASFPDLLGTPTLFYQTPWMVSGFAEDTTHMINFDTTTVDTTLATVELTAVVTNSLTSVDYIAFKP